MAPNKIDLASLEDWCKWMHDFCKSKSLHNVAPIMSESAQREDDEGGKMWGDESARGAWLRYEKMDGVGSNVSLNQLVGFAFALCCYIWRDYKKLSKKVREPLMHRLLPPPNDDVVDGGVQELCVGGADGEAYLRRLYLCLKNQGMVYADGCNLSGYFGCRQQCLYGCVCFCLLVMAMFHGDRTNMPCIDWINHVVLDGGCARLGFCMEMGVFERCLLNGICEMDSRKSIVNCVFDIVNTRNPSGGMIEPGNCQWFHNMVLFLTGGVSDRLQKLLKNHAALHDAFGFMLNTTDIGRGYGFGLFPGTSVYVSSAGAGRSAIGKWLLSLSWFGQCSGLISVHFTMNKLKVPFLNECDDEDIKERSVVMVSHLTREDGESGGTSV